jgi:serine phosphatase RsbU (regulator of sigma subunit)
LFKPRDIVSGDFYWCAEAEGKLIITAADCTGHGVPGAMMSMLGMNSLNTIVKVRNVIDPGAILNDLRASVVRSFADKGENAAKDGMDICMLTIDKENGKLMYAGAYNSLLQIRNGELTEYKVDKFPCALSDQYKEGILFQTNIIDVEKGDCYYFFSDGYCDQFGGPDGSKKFMKARFKRHLLELWNQPMEKQKEELDRIHLEFKGQAEQIDDILVIGIRI